MPLVMSSTTRQSVRVAGFIAPALLCAVALIQIVAARTTRLTAWKGGGFGMFSTIDSPSARFIRIQLETDRGVLRVGVPSSLQRDAARLREAPDEAGLHAFAARMASGTWVADRPIPAEARYALLLGATRDGENAPPPVPPSGEVVYRMLTNAEKPRAASLNVRTVCVEVLRYRIAPNTTRLVADLLAQTCAQARPKVR
jgi:hypothetical protein